MAGKDYYSMKKAAKPRRRMKKGKRKQDKPMYSGASLKKLAGQKMSAY